MIGARMVRALGAIIALFAAGAHSQYQVRFKDEGTADPGTMHLRMVVDNKGTSTLNGFRLDFYFQTPAGKTPQFTAWDAPGGVIQLEKLSVDNYRLRCSFPQVVLAPGQSYNWGNGALIGISLVGFFPWSDRASSWSYVVPANSWILAQRIPLFSMSGSKLWGEEPPPAVPPEPTQYLVKIVPGEHGYSEPTGDVKVSLGGSLSVRFEAQAGWRVAKLIVDGVERPAGSSWNFTNVREHHEIRPVYEIIPSTQHQVIVQPALHGWSNVSGAVLVPQGNSLNIRFYPEKGYEVGSLRLDGVEIPISKELDLVKVDRPHQVEVRFALSPRFYVQAKTSGSGRVDPAGDILSFKGEARSVYIIADPGNQIEDVLVDGKSVGRVPQVHFADIQGNHSVEARFRKIPATGASLELRHREEGLTEPKWSKPRLVLKNTGTQTFGPYSYHYYFRCEPSQVPLLSEWSMPAARGELQSLGDGLWRVIVRSSSVLSAGQVEAEGQGNYFGLNLNGWDAWDRGNDPSFNENAGIWKNNPKVPVYDGHGNLVYGTEPDLRIPANLPLARVKALYVDEGGDANYLRPRILIRNEGDTAFSDFHCFFYFQTESGKIPVRDDWYNLAPKVSLESLGGGQYRVRYDFIGVAVGPRSDLPNSPGSIMGLHYADWSLWDRSNDYSHNHSLATLQPDPRIPIYDKYGRLVWGEEPEWVRRIIEPLPPTIVNQPQDITVDEGQVVSFVVNAIGDAPISFQWRRNGADLADQVANTIQFGPVEMTDDGDALSCVITNTAGRVVSRRAILHVRRKLRAPQIVRQTIGPLIIAPGGKGRIDVVTDPSDAHCTWTRNGVPYPAWDGKCSDLWIYNPDDARSEEVFRFVARESAEGPAASGEPIVVTYETAPPTSVVFSISGTLEQRDQVAVGRGSSELLEMVARLYAEETGGKPLYFETHTIADGRGIRVRDGRFVIQVGAGRSEQKLASVLAEHPSAWLELAIGDDVHSEELGTRMRLTGAPFEIPHLIQDDGEPSSRWTKAAIGTLYIDRQSRRTWRMTSKGWLPIDR